jgi:hypothetical protein
VRALNLLLMKLRRRAEASDPAVLVETFVDVGPLFTRMSSADHQILSGRRGTGKTHALYYLEADRRGADDLAIFVDMRRLGSTGGLYADTGVPLTERGTRLLCDTLEHIHDKLVDFALERFDDEDMTAALLLLDRLADEVSRVVVVGTAEQQVTESQESQTSAGARVDIGIGAAGPQMAIGLDSGEVSGNSTETTIRQSGEVRHRIQFGAVTGILEQLMEALPIKRLWILFDEWSDTPMELQPLLADLLRRAFFPVPGITVKIGAIEQRSHFREIADGGGHVGIEIGADAAADLDLDDFMVFGSDAEKAKDFFRELLFRHVRALGESGDNGADPEIADHIPTSPAGAGP